MRLADFHTTIKINVGDEPRCFTLKASLRAVHALALTYEDFHELYVAISNASFCASCDLIGATQVDSQGLVDILTAFDDVPFIEVVTGLRPQLLDFVEKVAKSIAGGDTTNKPQRVSKPITLEAYVNSLYRIGAGWLGWSPDQVWDATPAEIIEAQRGLIKKLQAIHGSGENQPDDETDDKPVDFAAERARLRRLAGGF